jgi:hypothetical protein
MSRASKPKDIPTLLAQTIFDIADAINNPMPSYTPDHPELTRKDIGVVYSNCFHDFDTEIAAKLLEGVVFATHTAWDFHASIWYEDGQYHSYVMQYRAHVATHSDPDLMTLIKQVNSIYGED